MDEYKCPNCCRKGDEDLIELKILSSKELDGLKRLHRSLMVSDPKHASDFILSTCTSEKHMLAITY